MKRIIFLSVLIATFLNVYAQDNIKDSIEILLADKSLTPNERVEKVADYCREVINTMGFADSDIPIFYEIVFPFIDKEIKESSSRNLFKTRFHQITSVIYYDHGDLEKQGEEIFKALEAVKKTDDAEWQAHIFASYGRYLMMTGDLKTGHEYIYDAISYYNETGNVKKVIHNLYGIGCSFQQTHDIEGYKRVFNQMESYSEGNQTADVLEQIYSLKSLYYGLLLEQYPDNESLKDSQLFFDRKRIYLIENHSDELDPRAYIWWNYYNYAIAYKNRYPDGFDTMRYYLNKALEVVPPNTSHQQELEVSVYSFFSGISAEQGNYEQAEKEALHALSLLENLKDQSIVTLLFTPIYWTLVRLYEEIMNRPDEALKYQKLLMENERVRFDSEKINAINDMSIKYEVEKKEAQIEYLELKNETARKINLLIFSLLVILVVAIVFIVISNRLRKKNLQQSIYESALLNELQQTELEKSEEEKLLLQQEQEKLNYLAGESQKKAEEYAAQLQFIKQQLELKPTQTIVQKIQETISKSLIDNYQKKEYLEKLSNLDIDMLEQGYLTSDEKITNMDMKYIVCFAADMEVKDISLIFNVEPTSVHTVRYRIKKKFQGKNTFKFLI